MARSKNRQRNSMANVAFGEGRGRNRIRDWLVGGAACGPTGTPITSSTPTTWNSGPITVAEGSSITFQVPIVQPTPMSSTPTVGRLKVDRIAGRIFFDTDAETTGQQTQLCAVGIYVSTLNNTTTTWNVRNFSSANDAVRDDYLFLEALIDDFPTLALNSAMFKMSYFDLSISRPVVIGGGEALNITVCNLSSTKTASTTMDVYPFFRALVGPVA